MIPDRSNRVDNLLLSSLSPAERKPLERAMSRVEFHQGEELFLRNESAGFVYFPLRSTMVCLLQVDATTGDTVEVGVVGREGLVGLHILLNAAESHTSVAQVQIPGPALALPAPIALDHFTKSGGFRRVVLHSANLLLGQFAQTALCNKSHSIEERFARWLLESLDRADSNLLPLTHEMVARLLGVRRSSVTLSAGNMQQAGLINIKRGGVEVLDRVGLQKVSCGCYVAKKGLYGP